MQHWSDKYVGIPYQKGETDCAAIAVRVQSEVFNKVVNVPSERWARIHRADQIQDLKDDFAIRTNDPKDGDGVLLICRGTPSHIGLVCEINNQRWILHSVKMMGVVRHKEIDLWRYNLTVEGYYKWK